MVFRKFDTCIWIDRWFEKLTHQEKFAFIYLWTNDHCNQAGFYEISLSRIEYELGFNIEKTFLALKPKVEWFPDCSTVWVKNFFRHQCQNDKFCIAALNSLKQDAFKLQLFIEYNSNILSAHKINLSKYESDMV